MDNWKSLFSLMGLTCGMFLISACARGQEQPDVDPAILAIASKGVSSNEEWQPTIAALDGVQMALAPAGCFMMGSDKGHDSGGMAPAHEVCFEEPFWIDVYEVTQGQFARFDGEAGRESCFSGNDRPRECVTWSEADTFCRQRGARLPTEAEWEYAALGPDALRFPWGEVFYNDRAVFSGNSGGETADVGSKPAGASWLGVHDLVGNAYEWVGDWHGELYYESLEPGAVNPQGPQEGTERVLRGGSWISVAVVRYTAIRYKQTPDTHGGHIGFRCASSFEQ